MHPGVFTDLESLWQVTGVIRNKPAIIVVNGEGGASQLFIIKAEYADSTPNHTVPGPPPQLKLWGHSAQVVFLI